MSVRIERATRTVAYMSLAGVEAVEAPVEAGAVAEEGEEEALESLKKRTRRGTRAAAGLKKPAPATKAAEEPAAEAEPESEAEEAVATAASGAETPPKKKTRRGTRGGRGRKKPAAVVSEATPPEGVPAEAAAEVSEPKATGSIVTESVDGEPVKKKKTRRGTRGGRGRKPAAATNGSAAEADVAEAVSEKPVVPIEADGDPSENGAGEAAEERRGGARAAGEAARSRRRPPWPPQIPRPSRLPSKRRRELEWPLERAPCLVHA